MPSGGGVILPTTLSLGWVSFNWEVFIKHPVDARHLLETAVKRANTYPALTGETEKPRNEREQ